MAALQHESHGFKKKKTILIPNGFDADIFYPNDKIRKRNREKYCIREDEIVLGHIARYHPMKGHANLICALRTIVKCNYNIKAMLVGAHVDSYNKPLMQLIKIHGLSEHVLLARRVRKHTTHNAGV